MTEHEARQRARAINAAGGNAIATHGGRTRQDRLPSAEWSVVEGPVTFK